MSSEVATVTLANGTTRLVQNCQASYSQTVDVKYEIGSSDIYFVTGQPKGDLQIGRLVGTQGFFADLGNSNACGTLTSIGIGLDGQGGCVAITQNNPNGLLFAGAVPYMVGIQITAGSLEVRDSVALVVARMSAP
jgi:hypothetical protein